MASFRSTVVTNTGIRVINTALANKQELKISSIKSGNGVYTGGENLENATGLKDLKNSFHIKNIKLVDDATIKIQALITNDDITVGYDITEYGIYAEVDGAEKLIAIATAINADFIPSKESSPASILLEIYLKVSRAKEIHFSYIVPEGVYATVVQLNDLERIVDKTNAFKEVWMRAAEFTTVAPYTLRIDTPWLKAGDTPIVSHSILDGVTDPATIKGAWKSYSCIDKIEVHDGYMIVKCFRKKPTQDILLAVKGG